MSDLSGNWCLIESDPGVFSELIRDYGAKDVQVEELWSLEKEDFDRIKPIYGLVFLYKWNAGSDPGGTVVRDSRVETIYFAKQVIVNACATQALLSILLNSPGINLGPTLTDLKDFCIQMDPAMRGLALSNSETIRQTHNSFSRQTLFEIESKEAEKDDDVFHFVSYVPIDGRLYELDGLQEGPIDHGGIPPNSDWLEVARDIIQKRIKEFKGDEIHFNLMAVTADKSTGYRKEVEAIQKELAENQALTDEDRNEKMVRLTRLESLLQDEHDKKERWRVENIRRKHNYVPFIVELLKILGNQGMLLPLYEKAKQKVIARAKRAAAEGNKN